MFYLIYYSDGDKSQEIPLQNNLAGSLSMPLDYSIYGRDDDNRGEMNYFNLSTILTATNNFSDANKLGEGGFGPVYKVKKSIIINIYYSSLEIIGSFAFEINI